MAEPGTLLGEVQRGWQRFCELEALLDAPDGADTGELQLVIGDAIAARPKSIDALAADLRRRGLEVREITERQATPEEALEVTRGLVRDYVRTVWLEDDGTITVEGPLASVVPCPRS